MIILISGATHTGKTFLAQNLLNKYGFPYLSIDLIKMGLIRSGNTELTAEDDVELQGYLWPIIRETVKTAIENNQNLIIEGGYIPFDWKNDFNNEYAQKIKFYCLIMSKKYILNNYDLIKMKSDIIEKRMDDLWCTQEHLIRENQYYLEECQKNNCNYILIDDKYEVIIDIL